MPLYREAQRAVTIRRMFQRNWDKLYSENDLYVATGKNIFQMIATIFYIVSPYFASFLFFFSFKIRFEGTYRPVYPAQYERKHTN